jgi:hypothetical protein
MMRNLTNLACMRNETDISDDRFASNGMFNCREESTNRCLQVIASENSLIFSEAVPRNTMILGTSGLSYTVVWAPVNSTNKIFWPRLRFPMFWPMLTRKMNYSLARNIGMPIFLFFLFWGQNLCPNLLIKHGVLQECKSNRALLLTLSRTTCKDAYLLRKTLAIRLFHSSQVTNKASKVRGAGFSIRWSATGHYVVPSIDRIMFYQA